jgi:hypothetical protein
MSKYKGLFILLTILAVPASLPVYKIIKAEAYRWLLYAPNASHDSREVDEITDVFLILVDHWEPGKDVAGANKWLRQYRAVALRHRDASNTPLRYTWAYPCDRRNRKILSLLSRMVFDGFGEVEVHWHHHHKSTKKFEVDLKRCFKDFSDFGALVHENSNHPQFAFVHGNWALDNSEYERHCGINSELDLLQKLGAYADLTFPAPVAATQPRQINSIYRAIGTPAPKSYDTGIPVAENGSADGLMMIQGPLGLDFRNPLIFFENGALDDQEITGFSGTVNSMLGNEGLWQPHRVNNWLSLAPSVVGKPEWVFIKLHAHGMQHRDFIFELIDEAVTSLEDVAASRGIKLHFVSAREAYNLIRSLEAGEDGEPTQYFNFEIGRPLNQIREYSDSSS